MGITKAQFTERQDKRITRLERMVFLMLSIMNGTTFTSGRACDTFGEQLKELWALQREGEVEREPLPVPPMAVDPRLRSWG